MPTATATAPVEPVNRQITFVTDDKQLALILAFMDAKGLRKSDVVRVFVEYGLNPAGRFYPVDGPAPRQADLGPLVNKVTFGLSASLDAKVRAFARERRCEIAVALRVMISYGAEQARRLYKP